MILDGKHIAEEIEKKIKQTIEEKTSVRPPGLAFIRVGENSASKTYIKMKKRKCQEVGILSFDKEFPETVSESTLLKAIHELNEDGSVDGILVQLPLPGHISTLKVIESVLPSKDVDGFHPINLGKVLIGEPETFYPCTPHGILMLLHHYKIPISGKHAVIVGRSNIVGKPLAAMLMQKNPETNATVTIAHSGTKNLAEVCKTADILIAAMGTPKFINASFVKPGAVVIDVGINRFDGKIVGDVDFESVFPLTSCITPVPKGIGPMTIAMLLSNTLLSYMRSI
ncbi:MAG: bifunctional methylenetetrahydrofolate dehydrogenase/methenyltetrahydrofolate cyclohydrolase FolD [Chlamydiota bacterium]